MIKFRAWYMPFGKYGAMQEMVYSRASHILVLAETEPEKYIPEQFTGLTDVNGKDIYEGDIVRILSINVISDIKYMRDGVTPEFEIDRQKVFDEDNVLGTATCESDIEVIGNVHENAELLKG
ncbi:YopX family protein [Lactiplantibacillus plantarum]|uniref:YopX family protein n=1 Tax=Lactiplantibacillus plantarum TaxID=1590 RepID=UPI003F539D7B